MISPNDAITAFLAALVATPDGEPLPPFNRGLFDDPDQFIDDAEDKTGKIPFWTKYDKFHAQLVKGYTAKERAKILRSTVSSEDSDEAAEMEITNVTLSAEEIISSPEPIQTARESYVESGLDPLSWSVGLTGWQP
ncbi:hypothetical protein VB712_09905 [Spirulina sp. CCNP1310]|uniref:hypothetical protein n=1 Tax=Spirulina sp. CCNP1310 TaxID=3110249 RepID=UPI002B20F684|nr:hypothetical protein [Spirulina sp. CCNP1310]MEA5419538.1 hypothetical protein [Spirulina sp. CCNP1310]